MTNVSPRELRNFGLVVGGVFGGIALWLLLRSGGESWPGFVFAIIAAALILFGAAAPKALKGPFRAWMVLALILGWINTRLILGVTFYTMFVLGRLFLILTRSDPMQRRLLKGRETYWEDIKTPEPDRESYEHSF